MGPSSEQLERVCEIKFSNEVSNCQNVRGLRLGKFQRLKYVSWWAQTVELRYRGVYKLVVAVLLINSGKNVWYCWSY